MLYESIKYKDNLPFFTTFSNVREEDYHMHRELEMMLVLQGSTNCTIHHLEYEIKKDDILIVDTQDIHRIHDSSEDLIMLTLYIDLEQFTDKFPNVDYTIFTCEDCTKGSVEKYQELQNKTSLLKSHMVRMMMATYNNTANRELLLNYIDEFISVLVEQFQGFFMEDLKFKTDQGQTKAVNFERLYRMVKYIYMNFDKNISLRDVAETEHLSHYYVSHLIKDSTGLSFQSFLNYIRVEMAEEHLIEGKLTLTQISEFCGFSSLAYFNKCFKTWHGITPSTYKKKLKRYERTHTAPFSEEHAVKLLSSYTNDYIKVDVNTATSNHGLDYSEYLSSFEEELGQLNEEGKKNALSYIKYLNSQSEYHN